MTEVQCLLALPFLQDWEEEERALFVHGMNLLEGIPIKGSPAYLVAVVIIENGSVDVRVLTKAKCLERAKHVGCEQEVLDAIARPGRRGELDVLLIAGPFQAVFGLPVRIVSYPPSELN